MTQSHPPRGNTLRLADLPGDQPTDFTVEPDAAARAALAATLGIVSIRKLRLSGRLIPMGARDWRLEAMLGATVVQSCVVTLDPVVTRIDEPVTRSYLADFAEPDEGGEIEMPADDTAEPLPETVDLAGVLAEALALALPAFPRAPGAELAHGQFTEPGKMPLSDEDAKPFAALGALRDKLRRPQ